MKHLSRAPHWALAGGPSGLGRGGKRKLFDAQALRLIFLALIESQPRHGYDIIRDIEARTGGAYAPSPGIVYPTLTMLEELGHIGAAPSEGARRLFNITPSGKTYLQENEAAAVAAASRLDALREDESRPEMEPVRRAVHNLRAVLNHRLNGRNQKEDAFAIADILDEAARRIERL